MLMFKGAPPVSGDGKSPVGVSRVHLSQPTPPVDSTGGAAKTYDVQNPAKRKPLGMRLIYQNLNVLAAAVYTACRVGASPKHLNAYGNEITWWPNPLTVGNNSTPITFTGALSAATAGTLTVAWAGTTGTYTVQFSDGSGRTLTLTNGSTSVTWTGAVTATASATAYPPITVPAAIAGATANHVIPGFVVTDFVPLAPVARTDTPTGKYLYRIRSRSAAETQYVYNVGSGYAPAWNAYVGAAGMVLGSYQASGDFATSQPTDATYYITENGGYLQPVMALYAYEEPAIGFWMFGDSLPQGIGTSVGATASTGVLGFPTLIELQQTYIDALNMAVAGQKTADSIAIMKRLVLASDDLPKYIGLKVYGPNDGNPTQALIDEVWGRVLEACSWLRTKGITPILFTSPPVNAWNSTQHGFNEAQNTRARTFVNSAPWVKLVDFWAIVADPTNTRRILPAYDYGDGLHLLDAAQQAVADATVAKLT